MSTLDVRSRKLSKTTVMVEMDGDVVDNKRVHAHERLRGNHIAMMEMLQQLTDENAMLRQQSRTSSKSVSQKRNGPTTVEEEEVETDDNVDSSVLFKKISDLNDEIKDLKMRLLAAEDDKKTLKKQMNLARQEDYDSRKKDKADLKTKTEELDALKSRLAGEEQTNSQEMERLLSENVQLKEKNVLMLQNTAVIEEKNHALDARITELTEEIESMRQYTDVLIQKVTDFQEQCDHLTTMHTTQHEETTRLMEQWKHTSTVTQEKNDSLMTQLTDMTHQLTLLTDENNHLRETISHLEDEINRLQTALDTTPPDSANHTSFFLTTNRHGEVKVGSGVEITSKPGSANDDGREMYCLGCQQNSSSQFFQFVSLKKEIRTLKLQLMEAQTQKSSSQKRG